MTNKKTIFIAFAMKDEHQRDLFKGQALNKKSPFDFIDMSVKEPYKTKWKEKVRTRIKRSDGVIVLVSKNSQDSQGQKWEIECAKEEEKEILGIWAYSDDKTPVPDINTKKWKWEKIKNFINNL